MEKVGIMRINSYNKFFAKIANIMSTSVKAVKTLDCSYKVELANHVYLNVHRGVGGSLSIHDHRGISHITSCYYFEDFKTMEELYERLVSDYSEPVKKEATMNAYDFGKMSLPCLTCKHFCVRFDNDRIKMTHCVRKNMENYLKAAKNPNWHCVSLANIDNDKLDKKRQCYMHAYHLLKDFRKYAFETSRREVYFDLVRSVLKEIQQGYFNNKISINAYNYVCRHIESVSVEKNYFASNSEQAFGYKESKRYKITLR